MAIGHPLHEHVDLDHPLAVLADIIDWDAIKRVVPVPAVPGPGQPVVRTRLIAGLLCIVASGTMERIAAVSATFSTVAKEHPIRPATRNEIAKAIEGNRKRLF